MLHSVVLNQIFYVIGRREITMMTLCETVTYLNIIGLKNDFSRNIHNSKQVQMGRPFTVLHFRLHWVTYTTGIATTIYREKSSPALHSSSISKKKDEGIESSRVKLWQNDPARKKMKNVRKTNELKINPHNFKGKSINNQKKVIPSYLIIHLDTSANTN